MAHIPMPGAAIPYRPPNNLDEGPNMKGGGLRGGPRRWTGKGPQPARHIPWPEIFKHHISLIEGHHKMLDMVRKHTVEGTGNHRMMCDLLNRSNQILADTKQISRNFVPPKSSFDKVPLGAGSASMYPGYSPADHEYGQAAMEYGKAVAEARAQGVDFKPGMDLAYEIGQSKGNRKKKLEGIRDAKAGMDKAENEAMGTGDNVTEQGEGRGKRKGGPDDSTETVNGTAVSTKSAEGVNGSAKEAQDDDTPVFSLDANPTPLKPSQTLSNGTSKDSSSQQPASQLPDQQTSEEPPKPKEKPSKKLKTSHPGPLPEAPQFEDISAEVDARLQEKEKKRKEREEKKSKKEKKRKRESGDSEVAATTAAAHHDDDAAAATSAPVTASEAAPGKMVNGDGDDGANTTEQADEKPKRKKHKKVKTKDDAPVEANTEVSKEKKSKKRASEEREEEKGGGEEGSKKGGKRRKKNKGMAEGVVDGMM